MIAIFATAIIAYSAIPSDTHHCPEVATAIQKADRDLFLDPSPKQRAAITTRLTAELLRSFRTPDSLRREGSGRCVIGIARALLVRGDPILVVPALRENAEIYERLTREGLAENPNFAATLLGRELLEAIQLDSYFEWKPLSLDAARVACRGPQLLDCHGDTLRMLLVAGEKIPAGLIEKRAGDAEGTAHLEWIALVELIPDRLTRLEAALAPSFPDRGSGHGRSAHSIIRSMALDALLSDRDPRRWDPSAVAIVVHAARRADEAAIAAEASQPADVRRIRLAGFDRGSCGSIENDRYWATARSSPSPSESDIQRCRVHEILERLTPMGAERAFDLIAPKSIPRPATTPWSFPHFPGEVSLYASEFKPLPADSQKDAYRRAEVYSRERWMETDRRAPAPSLDRVRKSVAKKVTQVAPRPAGPPSKPALLPFESGQVTADRRECCANGASPCSLDLRRWGRTPGRAGTCDGDPSRFAPLPERVFTSSEVMREARQEPK